MLGTGYWLGTSETGFCSPRCQAGHFEWKHTLDNLELGPAGKGES